MRITVKMDRPVFVRCECGIESWVADLEAAVHWAFCEGMRHGRGCNLDMVVEMMLHVEHTHGEGKPHSPG